MPKYKILKEVAPNEFADSGDIYDDQAGPVQDRLTALQQSDGVCRAAELIVEE